MTTNELADIIIDIHKKQNLRLQNIRFQCLLIYCYVIGSFHLKSPFVEDRFQVGRFSLYSEEIYDYFARCGADGDVTSDRFGRLDILERDTTNYLMVKTMIELAKEWTNIQLCNFKSKEEFQKMYQLGLFNQYVDHDDALAPFKKEFEDPTKEKRKRLINNLI